MGSHRYGKLPPHVAYAVPAAVIGLSLYASSAPSPLYDSYAALWGFSTAVLTLIYATYAIGVLVALLLAGRLSDDIGRRPVLIAALIGIMASTILFAVADSVVWLFVARAVQGLATGLALSAAGAALFDLHPRRDPVSAGLTNGVSSAVGPGLGIIVSAALVQFAPAPRVLPYAVEFVLLAITLIGTLLLKEPITKAPGARIRLAPQRPGIHPDARRPFLLAALAVTASWSILGLYLSLGPDLATDLLHTRSLFASGAVVFLLPCAAAVLQLTFGRGTPWLGAALGALGLAIGVILLIIASAISSRAGFGATFQGGLRALSAAVPHEHRATVMSAFYVVAYLALSIPAIVAGFLASAIGLGTTFEILGSIIAAIALIVAVEAWRTRPDQAAIEAAEIGGI
jgi:MFS family permease